MVASSVFTAVAAEGDSECTRITYCSSFSVASTSADQAASTPETPGTARRASISSSVSPKVETTRMSMRSVPS